MEQFRCSQELPVPRVLLQTGGRAAKILAEGLSPEHRGNPHGRHGDLKPENIHLFKEEAKRHNGDFICTLKITAFSFVDFHSEHSRSNVRKGDVGGVTDTY